MSAVLISAADLVFRGEADQPLTTSLVVAERFEKRHDNVLQSIERLECSAEFAALNFQASDYTDASGRSLPSYRITRDGFMFLAMGFTGSRAAQWKEAFLAAFNAMELQLLHNHRTVEQLIASAVEMNAQTALRLGQAQAATEHRVGVVESKVDEVGVKVDRLSVQVTNFAEAANKRRRTINGSTKAQHRAVLLRRGWHCPCCEQEQATGGFEFDHFFSSSQADFEHTWPLCVPCHAQLTAGRLARGEVRSNFDGYQAFAKRELPAQGQLFGRS